MTSTTSLPSKIQEFAIGLSYRLREIPPTLKKSRDNTTF